MSSKTCAILPAVPSLPNYHREVLYTLPPLRKRHWLLACKKDGCTIANVWAKSLAAEADVCLCFKTYTKMQQHVSHGIKKKKKSSRANESQKHERLGWRGRLLAFHWALASHVVRVAVVHLQLPPWLREGVHCGRGGQWRAMVCLYMHLKVGRSGETWDQKNKEQGSCLTHSRPWLRGGASCYTQWSDKYQSLVWPEELWNTND